MRSRSPAHVSDFVSISEHPLTSLIKPLSSVTLLQFSDTTPSSSRRHAASFRGGSVPSKYVYQIVNGSRRHTDSIAVGPLVGLCSWTLVMEVWMYMGRIPILSDPNTKLKIRPE